MAEADCTAAIEMDEFYVKAYHRRATARISLKRYGAAAQDIKKMLKLEPANKEARAMLVRVNKLLENSKVCAWKAVVQKMLIPSTTIPLHSYVFFFFVILKPLVLSGARTKITEAETEKEKMLEIAKSESKTVKIIEAEKTKKKIKTFLKLPAWLPEVLEDTGIVEVITKPPHQRSKASNFHSIFVMDSNKPQKPIVLFFCFFPS